MNKLNLCKNTFMASVFMGCSFPATGLAITAPVSPELSRIVLSTGGVGYYEFVAELEGTQTLELGVRVNQVDDVLKSLVVHDAKGNWVDVTLPGQSPKSSFFKTVPFDEASLSQLPNLLSHLQGEMIEVTGQQQTEGQIINVVPETSLHAKSGLQIKQHRVYVATEEGVASFILEQADHIKFASSKLQNQFNDVLTRLADYRKNDYRKIRIVSHGTGKRTISLGYVTAAPVWKTSYRLNVPAKSDPNDEAQTAWLQGWAILENDSAQDWDNIQLTLASGQPVTFKQNLYESYYIQRPQRPVPVPRQAIPRRDDGAISRNKVFRSSAAPAATLKQEMIADMAPPALAHHSSLQTKGTQIQQKRQFIQENFTNLPTIAQKETPHVFFTFPQKLTVSAGHSIMIPIMNADLPAQTKVLYQEDRNTVHPFATVTLKNNTATNLPAGALTLYDNPTGSATGGYIGDAELSSFPKGDSRLIPFALDTQTRIDMTQKEKQRLISLQYTDGLLKTKTKAELEKIYTISTPETENRLVILEVPRLHSWDLAQSPSDDIEITSSHYRIPVSAEKNKTFTRSIRFSKVLNESVEITDPSQNGLYRLKAYLENATKSPTIEGYLSEISGLLTQDRRVSQKLSRIQQQMQAIYRDQKRVQENLSALNKDSDLNRRYRKKLSQQEDQLEKFVEQESKLHLEKEEIYEKTVAFLKKIDL